MKLYNILMFVVPFVMLIISLTLVFKLGYRVGYTEGRYGKENKENVKEYKNKLKPFKKTLKESEEERLFNISLQNIEAYDGTDRGQKEVK